LFDGDTVAVKACWTKESNEDAERYISSYAYIIDIQGSSMRAMTLMGNDFILNQYIMTKIPNDIKVTEDCNKVAPKYVI